MLLALSSNRGGQSTRMPPSRTMTRHTALLACNQWTVINYDNDHESFAVLY